VGLTFIYAIEVPTRLFGWNLGHRLVGLFQMLTAIWLLYCTYAITPIWRWGPRPGSSIQGHGGRTL
jgi:hypothetical protein